MSNKVLICTSHFYPNVGGVETHLADLVAALTKRNWRVYVATYKPLAREIPAPQHEKKGRLEIYRMPWPGFNIVHRLTPYPPLEFIYLFPGLFLVNLIVLLKNPDISVIHAQGLVPGVVAILLAKLFGKKVIVSTHNLYFFPKAGIYKIFSQFVLSKSDKILALSNQSALEIEALGVPKEKVARFRYWLDLDLFKPKPKKTKNSHLTIFFVGRLIETKGVKVLLAAAKDKRLKAVNFVFAGLGPLEGELKDASSNFLNIAYVGALKPKEVKKYMNAANIVAIPSTVDEGYGRVAMEALACGTPVLASNVGGLREVIDDRVGWLVEPKSSEFAKKIGHLVKNKNEVRLRAKNTRRYALSCFSPKNSEIIISAYKESDSSTKGKELSKSNIEVLLFHLKVFPFIILYYFYELRDRPVRALAGSGKNINKKGKWKKASPLPSYRYEFASGVLDGKVYTIGGVFLPSVWFPANRIEVYDPKKDSWRRINNYPIRVHHAGIAVCNGKLYVVGGNGIRIIPRSNVYSYDAKHDFWRKCANLPTARGALGVASMGGFIYAVGGGINKHQVRNLEVYNPKTDKWSKKAPMPTAREHLVAVAAMGKIFVLGGYSKSRFNCSAANEAYDPATDTWEKLAHIPFAVAGFAAVALGKSIFIFGGEQGWAVSKQVHEYKIDKNIWVRWQDLPTPRYALTANVLEGSIHVIGGNGALMGYNFSRDHDVFTP